MRSDFKTTGSVMCIAMALVWSGCSAAKHRQRADKVAKEIIEEKQRQALGRTEDFTIDVPEDSLRQRLIMAQGLPYSTAASLGTKNLDPIDHWPDDAYLQENSGREGVTNVWDAGMELELNLTDALKVAAKNSREYQSQKETVFQSALALDLERNEFRGTLTGTADTLFSANLAPDETVSGFVNRPRLGWSQRLKSGLAFTADLGMDIAQLLTPNESSSRGLFADASIFIPIMRGAGRHIVAEPLTQAEREVVYSIYDFERYKRVFAVRIASQYLSVLQLTDRVVNAEENYKRVATSARRARRLLEAGQLPAIQVDQALQDELRARDSWISAQESYSRGLDSFKTVLGLPTDAMVSLQREELDRLAENVRAQIPDMDVSQAAMDAPPTATAEEAMIADGRIDPSPAPAADTPIELIQPDRTNIGSLGLSEREAIELALTNRLDLRISQGSVYDAQRRVVVAADRLKAEVSLLGSGSTGQGRGVGSASLPNSDRLDPGEGSYSALLAIDLPFERTAEGVNYRNSLINLERTVRNLQALEDEIKLEIRNHLRNLLEARESLRIQAQAVAVAERRVRGANLNLEAGRAEMRDLLEAQDSLLSAQNALTAALVNYRVSELELQRDLGILQVSPEGLWQEEEREEPASPPAEANDDNT